MLVVDDFEINLQLLSPERQVALLNTCLTIARSQMNLDEASEALRENLKPLGLFAYQGGHHIAIGREGIVDPVILRLIRVDG